MVSAGDEHPHILGSSAPTSFGPAGHNSRLNTWTLMGGMAQG